MDFIQDWELDGNTLTILTPLVLSEVELNEQDVQTLTLTSQPEEWIFNNYFRLTADVESERIGLT